MVHLIADLWRFTDDSPIENGGWSVATANYQRVRGGWSIGVFHALSPLQPPGVYHSHRYQSSAGTIHHQHKYVFPYNKHPCRNQTLTSYWISAFTYSLSNTLKGLRLRGKEYSSCYWKSIPGPAAERTQHYPTLHTRQHHQAQASLGWWFQPLWKILVSWDYSSQYMEK